MRDASTEFEDQSKLVKAEFARFERERVDEFRRTLSANLDGQIARQRELVTAWEEYHASVLRMLQRTQAQQQGAQ
jgi:sorting nexin-1/2